MKTSTKLIIILFICIPTSLLAYNFILKAEYKKGNVIRELHPRNSSVYINKPGLAKFTHVVINGSLKQTNGGTQRWMAHVWIGGSDSARKINGNTLGILQELGDNLDTIVKNDTLYISFHVIGKFDNTNAIWNHETDIVKIYSNQVKSVNISDASVTVEGNPGTADSLKLTIGDYSQLEVKNLQLQKLAIVAKDNSSFNIRQTNKIGMLSYSLRDTSQLNIDNNPAQRYFAERVDSAAKIQITGKASVLQKQLH